MIFSELYSVYYNAVAHVIEALLDGERDEKALRAIISEYAFEESAACILPALHRGRWQLLKPDMTPTLQRRPTMPIISSAQRPLKTKPAILQPYFLCAIFIPFYLSFWVTSAVKPYFSVGRGRFAGLSAPIGCR